MRAGQGTAGTAGKTSAATFGGERLCPSCRETGRVSILEEATSPPTLSTCHLRCPSSFPVVACISCFDPVPWSQGNFRKKCAKRQRLPRGGNSKHHYHHNFLRGFPTAENTIQQLFGLPAIPFKGPTFAQNGSTRRGLAPRGQQTAGSRLQHHRKRLARSATDCTLSASIVEAPY